MTTWDAWRRWFGLLFLLLAGGMTTWGLTLLEGRLRGGGFLLYWSVCLGFLGLAMLIALWDGWVIRRRHRTEKASLARHVFGRPSRPESADGPSGCVPPPPRWPGRGGSSRTPRGS